MATSSPTSSYTSIAAERGSLLESNQIPEVVAEELHRIYLSLNPAELKRNIDAKLAAPYRVYEEKKAQLINFN